MFRDTVTITRPILKWLNYNQIGLKQYKQGKIVDKIKQKASQKRDKGFIDANISVAYNVMSTMAVKLIDKTRPTSQLTSTSIFNNITIDWG